MISTTQPSHIRRFREFLWINFRRALRRRSTALFSVRKASETELWSRMSISPFEINDEYEVRNLFEALLHNRFEDLRPEELYVGLCGERHRESTSP